MSPRPLAEIRDLVMSRDPRAGACRILAVDGPSGAGKTTLAARIAPLLEAPVLHLDHLYPGWDGLAEAPALLVDGVLRPFAEDRPAAYRRWSWVRDEWWRTVQIEPTPVLVVEGVGCGARVCAPYLTALLWIDADRGERMRRGIARDGERYRPNWERWAAQEVSMFAAERTADRADVRVDGDPATAYDAASEYVPLGPSLR